MNASEKIKEFSSLDALLKELQSDARSKETITQRYPVRFIMLDNFDTFRELSNELTCAGVDTLPLETILEKNQEDDAWITTDELKETICRCTTSTMITPFSELARFYSDEEFVGFFNEIIIHEDLAHPNKRIYIPLIGLKNRVEGFLERFGRIAESAPIWRLNSGSQSVQVYLSKYKGFDIPQQDNKCVISNFHEWLRFWKTNAPKPKIVCTALPIRAFHENSRPDNIFTFTEIDNAYDFLTNFLDIHLPFSFCREELGYYDELLKRIDKSNPTKFSFDSFVRELFNRVEISPQNLMQDWGGECTTFERWLLKKYAEGQEGYSTNYPYLQLCLSQNNIENSPSHLYEEVAQHIFFFSDDKTQRLYAKERTNLMQSSRDLFRQYVSSAIQESLRKYVVEIFQNQGDLRLAIDLCTQTFDFEKRLAMAWYVNYSKDGYYTYSKLAMQYPDLAAYLGPFSVDNLNSETGWVLDYISEYRCAKLRDVYTDHLANMINIHNKNSESFYHWYFQFKNSHDHLASQTFDHVYWIDGLGVEFIPFINQLVQQSLSGFHVVSQEITRSNIPTSTTHNRFVGDNVVKYGALDELGHDSHHYKKNETLSEEIKLVKDIVTEILENNKHKPNQTIVIVSDHGMSALSRLCDSKKYNKQTEHEGRYFRIEDTISIKDSDFFSHINETDRLNYIVALKHSSLGTKPTHEVHGGCTPEEVLTPFIVLSNIGQVIPYIIHPIQNRIPISKPVISLHIIPKPNSCKLIVEGVEYKMTNTNKDIWEATIKEPQEKTYSCVVKPHCGTNHPLEIEVFGIGFGESDINDDFTI